MKLTAAKLSALFYEIARHVRDLDSYNGRLSYEATEEVGVYEVEVLYHTGMQTGQGGLVVLNASQPTEARVMAARDRDYDPALLSALLTSARSAQNILAEMTTRVVGELRGDTAHALGRAEGAVHRLVGLLERDIEENQRGRSMTREEHLNWAKTRAFEFLVLNRPAEAVSSMISDLMKHEAFRTEALAQAGAAGLRFVVDAEPSPEGQAALLEKVRTWIGGFL